MKTTYTSPAFTEILIDKNISLVMATGNGSGEIPESPSFKNDDDDKRESEPFKSPFEN